MVTYVITEPDVCRTVLYVMDVLHALMNLMKDIVVRTIIAILQNKFMTKILIGGFIFIHR